MDERSARVTASLFKKLFRVPFTALGQRLSISGTYIHGSIRQLIMMLALFFPLLLTSCSHVRRDGPPNFYVDETKIPNAVPKVEPRAKYGNMNAYNVFGKRYKVMKSSKNYSAVGVASWYGTMFHNRKTSSGERYDMLAMTAAHRSLPLPTYVRVTNLKNNREVIVKVNDRGPFSQNRLIDLSYVAAKKLGMLGKGTTRVRVTAIDPHTFNRPSYGNKPLYANKSTKNKHKLATRTRRTRQQIAMKANNVRDL